MTNRNPLPPPLQPTVPHGRLAPPYNYRTSCWQDAYRVASDPSIESRMSCTLEADVSVHYPRK